jgi:two-component sensor histidine kinase
MGQIAPYVGTDGRDAGAQLQLSGESVRLDTQSGHALALVLHELTTNAVKYGALSREGGSIHLSWVLKEMENGRNFEMVWRETGGPPVVPPAHRGFGSILIEQSLSYALGGEADIRYEPEGLVACFRVTLKENTG